MIRRLLPFLFALKPTRLGVLFAVLVGLGVGLWQWGQPPRPRMVLEKLDHEFKAHFSTDGRTLAIIDGRRFNNSLTLWDVRTGQKKRTLCKDTQVTGVAFSPDCRRIACRFSEASGVWDVSDGRELAIYDCPHDLFFSPDGKLLAVGQDYELWDVVEKKLVKNPEVHRGRASVLREGNIVFVRDEKQHVKIWDLATATVCAERDDIPDFGEPARVTLSSNHRFLIHYPTEFIGHQPPVYIWDLDTNQKREFSNGSRFMTGAEMASDGQTFALGLWDPYRAIPRKSWCWFANWLGTKSERSDYFVVLRSFPAGDEVAFLNDCRSPMFSLDGRTLAVTSADGKSLQLWDFPIRKPIGKILGLAGLAAVATLLAFNALGWLRKRRHKTA